MRTCTVCGHAERAAIDSRLVEGGSFRDIAGQFSLSKSAVERHAKSHMVQALAKAAARDVLQAGELLERLDDLRLESEELLEQARERGSEGDDVALRAIARLEKQLELAARLCGMIRDVPAVAAIQIVQSDEWIRIRTALLECCGGCPKLLEVLQNVGA